MRHTAARIVGQDDVALAKRGAVSKYVADVGRQRKMPRGIGRQAVQYGPCTWGLQVGHAAALTGCTSFKELTRRLYDEWVITDAKTVVEHANTF